MESIPQDVNPLGNLGIRAALGRLGAAIGDYNEKRGYPLPDCGHDKCEDCLLGLALQQVGQYSVGQLMQVASAPFAVSSIDDLTRKVNEAPVA